MGASAEPVRTEVPGTSGGWPLWPGTVCFTVMVVALSGVYAWLRVRSGSVFFAALLHATSNAFVVAFEAITRHDTPYFSQEYGLSLAVVIPLVFWPFWRKLGGVRTAA